jgi:hypothetical protein
LDSIVVVEANNRTRRDDMAATAKQDKPVDAKALASAIAKGYKLVDTPKVRAGFKKGQQKLVQADGKTLGMLTLREKGVRIEGSRLSANMTVTSQADVAKARELLATVEKENAAKSKARDAKRTPQPKDSTGVKSTTTKRVEAVATKTGKRARSGSTTPKASKVA